MSSNLLRGIRDRLWKRKRPDLFKRIRVRLTVTYSILLILMLILFTVIVTGALFLLITQEQNRQVQALADEQLARYRNVLVQEPDGRRGSGNETRADADSSRFFTYVFNMEGELVVRNERLPELGPDLKQQLLSKLPTEGETRLLTLVVPSRHDALQVLLTGRVIAQDGEVLGMLYTGNDVSFYWQVFGWMARVFIVLIILFGVLSAVVGQRMAARAMVPIRSSYTKQQHFVADASHELRTPLAVLSSSIDVIDLEDGDHLSDMSKRVLADMKDEVQSMSMLVADLLTLARSDSGAVELYVQPFDLVSVAGQVVRLRQSLAQERGIVLTLDAPSTLTMKGDQERVKQLFAILIDNALNYTPAGGRVTIVVRSERTAYGTLRALIVRVEDTGIGIPPEEHEKIFERFYRVEEARTRAAGGTGIGLAIAKWIVQAHKGTIRVTSALGAGSTFIVRFPTRK